ncbi:MAG: hypothetical protein ACI31A_07465 [Candidatus Limisoma sp.]
MKIFDKIFEGNKYLKRKAIDAPANLAQLDKTPGEGGYCYFPNASSRINFDLWRSELGGCCVTLVLDDLLALTKQAQGILYVVLTENSNVENYVNLGTIEMISSGIRYKGSCRHRDYDVMLLDVDSRWIKPTLRVPDEPMIGFVWYKCDNNTFHDVATKRLGGDVVLNFAVCGEFSLSIYFSESPTDEILPIFSKDFCCK